MFRRKQERRDEAKQSKASHSAQLVWKADLDHSKMFVKVGPAQEKEREMVNPTGKSTVPTLCKGSQSSSHKKATRSRLESIPVDEDRGRTKE